MICKLDDVFREAKALITKAVSTNAAAPAR